MAFAQLTHFYEKISIQKVEEKYFY